MDRARQEEHIDLRQKANRSTIQGKKRFFRLIPVFICLLMVAASLSVTLALNTARRNEQLKEEHLRALDLLASSRARLESVIYGRFLLVRSMVGFIENNPNLDKQDFSLLSRDTVKADAAVLGVRIVRGKGVSFVYPESERLDLLGESVEANLPEQERSQIQRIVTESTPYLGGPVIGSDNREIFLLMIPIYQKIVGLPGTGPYWGMAIFELDANMLLHEAGIDQTNIAVRFPDRDEKIILQGKTEQFGPDAITVDLTAAWGNMQLAINPPTLPSGSKVIFFLGVGVALLLGGTSWLTAHQVLQRIRTQEQYRELVQNARSIILRVTPSGTISFFNEYAAEFFGFTEEEVLGKHLLQTILPPHNEHGQDMAGLVVDMLAEPDKYAFTEQWNKKNGGEEAWVSWAIRPMYDERNGQLSEILFAGTDITARKQLEGKLRDMATTDALTGIANRRHFVNQAEQEISRSKRYSRSMSLLMLDLDHFKSVNDTYGHDVGDMALRTAVKAITRILRDQDVCGRLGGEEFGVLLPETNESQAINTAERIRAEVKASPITLFNDENLQLTISIGLAELTEETSNLDALLKRADVALYEAKKNGRNRIECG